MKKICVSVLAGLVSTIMCISSWATDTYLPNPAASHMDQAPLIEIRNAKRAFPGILSGGQPTDAQLKEAKDKGFKTIINLRPVSEHQGEIEADTVRKLGMNYINIPVFGASGVTNENSQALIDALADKTKYPVMVHCASGNRVGALFALDAAQRAQMPAEEAIKIGRRSGLTGLEGVVKNTIEK